jgi:hypothetical protein
MHYAGLQYPYLGLIGFASGPHNRLMHIPGSKRKFRNFCWRLGMIDTLSGVESKCL